MSGANPRFLERGTYIYKGVGLSLMIFISFFIFLKYPMKMKKFDLTETKLFHFHRIFKNRGRGGGLIKLTP